MHPYDASQIPHGAPATAFPMRTHTPGWWNAYYYDHPGRKTHDQVARTGDKWKVYCMRCFEADIKAIEDKNDQIVKAGAIPNMPQTQESIRAYCECLRLLFSGSYY